MEERKGSFKRQELQENPQESRNIELFFCYFILFQSLGFFCLSFPSFHFHLNMPGTLIEISFGILQSAVVSSQRNYAASEQCSQQNQMTIMAQVLQLTSSELEGGGIVSLSAGSALCLERSGVKLRMMVTMAWAVHSSHYFIYLNSNTLCD